MTNKPTEAMIEAGADQLVKWQKCFKSFDRDDLMAAAERIYLAMLSSTPQEPDDADIRWLRGFGGERYGQCLSIDEVERLNRICDRLQAKAPETDHDGIVVVDEADFTRGEE